MNTKRTKKLSRRLVSILVTVAMVMGMLPVTNVQEARATSTGTTITIPIIAETGGTFTAVGDNIDDDGNFFWLSDVAVGAAASTTITAVPNPGYQFKHWLVRNTSTGVDTAYEYEENGTMKAPNPIDGETVAMVIAQTNSDILVAIFEARPTIAYIDKAATGGTVTVSDVTTECVVETTSQYKIVGGDLVPTGTVTAVPAEGYQFVRWDLKDKSTGQITREFAHDARLEINGGIAMMLESESGENANLVPVFKPTHITITADTGGTVSATGPQISENNMTWTSLSDIQAGANTITATPKLGYKFKYWTMKSSADSSGTTYISYDGEATNPIDGKDAATNLWNCDTLVAVIEPDPNYATVTMRETNQLVEMEIAGTYSETQFAFKGDVLLTYPLASGITNETLIITNNNEGEHIEKIIVYKQGTDEVVAEYDAAATYNATTDAYHSYNLFSSDTDLDAKVKAQSKITGLEIEVITTHDNVYYDRTLNIFAEPGGDYTATGTGVDDGRFTSYYNKALYMTRGTAFSDYKKTIITAVPNEGYTFKHWILRTLVNFDFGPIDDVVLGTIAKLDVEQAAKYIDKNCSYDDYNLNRGNSQYYIVAVFEPTQTTDTYSVWPKDAGKLVGTRYIPNDGYEFKYISLIRKAGTETDCTCGCDDSCPCKREFYSLQSYFHCDLPIVKGAFCCDKCFGNFDVTAFFVPTTNTTNFATLSFTSDYGIVSHDSYVMPIDATATAVPVISQGYDGTSFANWTTVVDGKETIISEKFTLDAETIKKYAYKDGQWVDTTFTANFSKLKDAILTFNTDSHGTVSSSSQTATDSFTQPVNPETGQAIDVTATASKGYKFVNWTIGSEVVSESETLSAEQVIDIKAKTDGKYVDTTFTAKFTEDEATITYEVNDANMGSVIITNPTTTRPLTQKLKAKTGVAVDATASAKPGYEFVRWEIGGEPIQEKTAEDDNAELLAKALITEKSTDSDGVYQNTTITAVFKQKADAIITYKVNASEAGTVKAPSDEEAAATTSEQVAVVGATAVGEVVATALPGYHFVKWTLENRDTALTSGESTLPQSVVVAKSRNAQNVYQNTTFVAHFELLDDVDITFTTADDKTGKIVGRSSTDTYIQSINPQLEEPDPVLVEPVSGYEFEKWVLVKDAVETPIPAEESPDGTLTKNIIDKYAKVGDDYVKTTFKAYFKEQTHVTLSYEASTGGSVVATTNPESINPQTGSPKGATASPEAGYSFSRWEAYRAGVKVGEATNNPLASGDFDTLAKVDGKYVTTTFKAIFDENEKSLLTFSAGVAGEVSAVGYTTDESITQPVAPATGVPVDVTFTASAGYVFEGWKVTVGGVTTEYTKDQLPETLTSAKILELTRDTLIRPATFVVIYSELPSVTLDFSIDEASAAMGHISPSTQTIDPKDVQIQPIQATANAGYHFVEWQDESGATITTENPLSVAMINSLARNDDGSYNPIKLKPIFGEDRDVIIYYSSEGRGRVSLDQESVAPATGDPQGATATADTGYMLDGWYDESGMKVSSQAEFVPTRTGGVYVGTTYTARFVVDPAYAPVLEVTNEPDVSYAQVGDEITYTITVSNTGYIDAEDTSIVYTLEDGYEYVSHEPSTGTLSGQTITWSGANIPADGSVEYKVTVKVKETASGNLGGGSISVSDSASGSSTTVESEDSGSSIPVISLPTDTASYTATWQRVTAATESSERDGVYGFIRGNLVEYEVTITNDSTMALTMDVEDTLADDGIFSDREIKSVAGATRNYDVESGVNITIAVGKTATVRFAVNVEANVDEYDDKQFGDAGHVNEVVISSVVATAELADGTTISYSKDGSVAGTNAWTGSGDPLADTTVSGTIPTREIDETVTYSLDINWADTVPTYRPASIKVALVRTDTGETVEEKTLTAEDRTSSDVWSTTFSPWPVYDTVDISPLSEVSMLEALLARSHAVSAAAVDSSTVESDVVDSSTSDSEVADIDVVDSDVADIIEDDTVADDTSADTLDSESTSDIVATDSEASIDSSDALDEAIETSDTDASATEEAGTADSIADETTESTEESDSPLLDGTVLDDTEVYDSRLHDVVAARRYILASLVSGLEDGEDRGEPIEYTVVVLSDVPDGYTMSEVTSTGEKFEVTLSRPWTPRQISSSGTSSSNGSSSSGSSSSGSSGSGSSSGSSGTGSSTSATGEIGPGIGLSSIGSTSSGSGSSTGTSTAQVGPGVGLSSTGSGTGSGNTSTSWGSSLAAKAIANALQSATGTAGSTGTTTGTAGTGIAGSTETTTGTAGSGIGDASTGTTGTVGTTGATTGLVESDILAGIGPARTSTYVFIAGTDGLWQAHTTGTTDSTGATGTTSADGATTGTGDTNTGAGDTTADTTGTIVTAGTVDISSLAGLGDVEFALADSSVLTNQWALIGTVAEEDSTITYEWYHFGDTGSIDTGWFTDEAGHWYYLSENSDGSLGSMSVGWQYSSEDGRWYYLDATTGTMLTGWQQIDGAWYYFTTGTPIETWEYNVLTRKWVYKNIEDVRPLGSLYIDETTPDGYVVGKSGAVEE